MSKKESEKTWGRKASLFLLLLRPLSQFQCTVSLIKTLAHKWVSLSLCHSMMDYSSVFLVFVIGSCTHSTGDLLFYYCLYLIVIVVRIWLLLQLLEESGEMIKPQDPQRYSFPAVEWIHYVWLFWVRLAEILKVFFFFFCLFTHPDWILHADPLLTRGWSLPAIVW